MNQKYKVLLLTFFCVIITSLWSNNIYLLFGFSFLCWLFVPQKKWWDRIAVAILLFSFFYGLMVIINGRNSSYFVLLSYIISPVAFYRFGRLLMDIYKDDLSRQKFLMFSVLLYLLNIYILTLRDIAMVGFINETRMLLGDIDSKVSATMYGAMLSIGIACIGTVFIKMQNLWVKLCYLVITILSLLCVIHLVNRTGLIIFVTCIVVMFFILTKRNVFRTLCILMALVVLAYIIINMGIIDQSIIDAYIQREDSLTTNSAELGGRKSIWMLALNDFYNNPLGWNSSEYKYVHNLWLDIARVGGLFSLIPFMFATLLSVKNLFRLSFKNRLSQTDIIIISITVSMFMTSFVEPIIDASILLLCILMMFWGITTSLSKENVDK